MADKNQPYQMVSEPLFFSTVATMKLNRTKRVFTPEGYVLDQEMRQLMQQMIERLDQMLATLRGTSNSEEPELQQPQNENIELKSLENLENSFGNFVEQVVDDIEHKDAALLGEEKDVGLDFSDEASHPKLGVEIGIKQDNIDLDFNDATSWSNLGEEIVVQHGVKKIIVKEGEYHETPENGDEVDDGTTYGKVKLIGKLKDGTELMKEGHSESEGLFEFKTEDNRGLVDDTVKKKPQFTKKEVESEVALETTEHEYALGFKESQHELAKEKIEAADKKKKEANVLFKAGKYAMVLKVEEKTTWKYLSFEEICNATNGFSSEKLIGKIGRAEVYKGILSNNDEESTVRRITRGERHDERSEGEFLMEIGTTELVSHPNVSSLLGCCMENGLYLVFISFSRGSVASLDKAPLVWETRLSTEKCIELFLETSESKKAVENSPFLEKLKKKGYGMLYVVAMVSLLFVMFIDGRSRQHQDTFEQGENQDRVREFHKVVHCGGSKSVKRARCNDAVDKNLKFPKKEDRGIKVIDVNDKGNHFFDFYLAEIGGKGEVKNIIHFGSFINVVVIVCEANLEFEDAHGDNYFVERLLSECHDEFGKPCLEVKYEDCKAKSREFLGSRVCGNYLKNAEKGLTVFKVTSIVSNGATTTVYKSINVCSTLTCARIEEFNLDVCTKGMKPFENGLRVAKREMTSTYHVILVDVSTNIPTVQLILQDFFKGKNLCKSINDNEAYAYGGAAQAVSLINGVDVYTNGALNVVTADNIMIQKRYPMFHLEDKVTSIGGGIDRSDGAGSLVGMRQRLDCKTEQGKLLELLLEQTAMGSFHLEDKVVLQKGSIDKSAIPVRLMIKKDGVDMGTGWVINESG